MILNAGKTDKKPVLIKKKTTIDIIIRKFEKFLAIS
jgi:hypothetical protein